MAGKRNRSAPGESKTSGDKPRCFLDVDIDDARAKYARAQEFVKAKNLAYGLSSPDLEDRGDRRDQRNGVPAHGTAWISCTTRRARTLRGQIQVGCGASLEALTVSLVASIHRRRRGFGATSHRWPYVSRSDRSGRTQNRRDGP